MVSQALCPGLFLGPHDVGEERQGFADAQVRYMSCNQPRCRAKRTRSARLLKPSFSNERALYVSTVLMLRSSRAAISLLLWPAAMRRTTSTSRSLRSAPDKPIPGA